MRFVSAISVYEEDQPPNSAISTATPPMVVGNRFFGPDFNIEQVKGEHSTQIMFDDFSITSLNYKRINRTCLL